MPQIQQFRLPDAGEGLTEAEIVSWKVQPGDTVRLNDAIVEIETAKSLVELPSPFAGVVMELLVDEGTTVAVGTPIIAVDTDPSGGGPGAVQEAPPSVAAPGGRTPVLVGYGPRTTTATRRARVTPASAPQPSAPQPSAPQPSAPQPSSAVPAPAATGHVLAKPPVRKLAKDLGLDLAHIVPTGPGGIVTRDDVEHAAAAPRPETPAPGAVAGLVVVGSPAERETRIPVKGVRRRTADAMVASAFTAPHVTEWLTVDVSRTIRLVERLRTDPEFAGVRVSPLLLVARALLLAVRRNPGVNATWDAAAGDIVIKHYVNLGIAAATPRGLIVPNIKDADRLTLRGLADALAALTTTAREGRTPPSDLAGGTITITNVGVFGVDAGTPILDPGQAAILAFGQVRQQPWVHKGKVKPRWVTQLSASFDHRLVDGDLGSRFLADIGAVLEDPALALVRA